MKIALVTDSSCDLDSQIVKDHNIEVIPLRIIYKDNEYRDGEDITATEVYNRLNIEIPTTSMPSPKDVLNKFQELRADGYTHILAITLSSGLSGTYNMFKLMSEEISDVVIDVIDSKTLSMVLGFIVIEASKLIKNNTPYIDIIDKINSIKSKAKGFYVLDTLEYLRKGGRIGLVASAIGTLLNIKPIISTNDEGKYYILGKTRGKTQAAAKMFEILLTQLENTKTNVAVLQGMAEREAGALFEKIHSLKNVNSLCISAISPTLVVHTGPGLIGLAYCPEE
jgi:DegV family protein with EDD domain